MSDQETEATQQVEWDVDETAFTDGESITEKDLATSPVLKVMYNRFISATNWMRWCLL